MKKILLALSFSCTFTGCVSECWCEKDLGCAVLTARKKDNSTGNLVVVKQIICTQTNYYSDWQLMDSIGALKTAIPLTAHMWKSGILFTSILTR